jgi:hypothetical protein
MREMGACMHAWATSRTRYRFSPLYSLQTESTALIIFVDAMRRNTAHRSKTHELLIRGVYDKYRMAVHDY